MDEKDKITINILNPDIVKEYERFIHSWVSYNDYFDVMMGKKIPSTTDECDTPIVVEGIQ